MPEKNALEELAKELKKSLDLRLHGTSYYNDRAVFCTPKVIDKAWRIVAELAKVEDWTNDSGADEPRPYSSVSAIKECRAIAEEGACDGK